MRTALHLVAMPLAYPFHPSSQLGYLHGYVEKAFGAKVEVRSHHAFLPILHDLAGAGMADFFEEYSLVGEEILYLCCSLSAMKHGEKDFMPAASFEDAFIRYNAYTSKAENESQQNLVPISYERLERLTETMETYLVHSLEPTLSQEALNIVGFTASFCQVFGSIFAARHLSRVSHKPILYLFGGSSFSLPEGSRTLANWTVDGLIAAGSGEAPLQDLIEAALELEAGDDPLATLASRQILNVSRVGSPYAPVDLKMSTNFMDSLPDPNYDDYFRDLRRLCSDDRAFSYACANFVSLPIEGSRGCFAKCDFCHNPNITSEFRSLNGNQVAERTLRLIQKYKVNDVTFVDSVSNTWAGTYADRLLSMNRRIQAFMELRVHAPETFWTKLSLCGATTLQLGIEAIASPLLKSMRKGTTVIQNLAATKYMAEMRTQDASNLIIHHPRSTVADAEETVRVMKLLEHFPIFHLSRFVVSFSSPLYNELSQARKEALNRGFDWLPQEMEPYGWPRHLSYTWPNAWTDTQVVDAWLRFQHWYEGHVKELSSRNTPPAFTVRRCSDGLLLEDTRFGDSRSTMIRGDAAKIYDACHRPRKACQLAEELELRNQEVQGHLDRLTEERALILVGDTYLSIALRPMEELISNYLDSVMPICGAQSDRKMAEVYSM